MIKDPINDFFEKKGINVIYNTLNSTETMIRSYIAEYQDLVDSAANKSSNHVKFDCYSKMYNFTQRGKFTGFEKLRKEDKEFRKLNSFLIKTPQFSPTMIVKPEENSQVRVSYKEELKKFVSSIKKPILYLSGGLDSELVANSMIDAGVKFIPVIFNFVDNDGKIYNDHDVTYAYKFCAENNLFPITKNINIIELWKSNDFLKLAVDMQVVSTQLVTHGYMINLMNLEFPGHTHVFGGEVRFASDYRMDDGRIANLVKLVKLNPTYDGQIYYVASVLTIGVGADVSLRYSNDGTWEVVSNYSDNGTSFINQIEASGNWTSTPGTAYEYAIGSATLSGLSGPSYSYSPTGTTAYSPIGTNTTICSATVNAAGSGSYVGVTWSILVRASGKIPDDVPLTTTIEFNVEYAP